MLASTQPGRGIAWLLGCLLAAWLAACSPQGKTEAAKAPEAPLRTAAEQYAALAQSAKGIAVGPAVSDYAVYVLFDPQCLHCARLWEEARPLADTVRFVWVPVQFFDGRSAAQSAVLLGSSSPVEDMDRHEASILARTGGLPAPDKVPDYIDAVVKKNTELINRFRVLAVPYVLARNQTTSEYVAHEGVMSREVLKKFLGISSR